MLELAQSFRSDGYVCCRGLMTSQLGPIRAELDRMIADELDNLPDEHVFYENKTDVSTLKQIQHLQTHSEFFRSLCHGSPLSELSVSLLGEPTTCQNVQYFNKPPGGQATPPHQDGYYFCVNPVSAVTMWIALDDVDEENGCVRYIPASHRNEIRSHGPTGTLGFSQGITGFPTAADIASEIAITAAPGDLLAHHAQTVHRADGNQSATRTRRAIGLIYYGESAKEDSDARNRYLQQLHQNQLGKI